MLAPSSSVVTTARFYADHGRRHEFAESRNHRGCRPPTPLGGRRTPGRNPYFGTRCDLDECCQSDVPGATRGIHGTNLAAVAGQSVLAVLAETRRAEGRAGGRPTQPSHVRRPEQSWASHLLPGRRGRDASGARSRRDVFVAHSWPKRPGMAWLGYQAGHPQTARSSHFHHAATLPTSLRPTPQSFTRRRSRPPSHGCRLLGGRWLRPTALRGERVVAGRAWVVPRSRDEQTAGSPTRF
jgi:hypothetical protein